MDLAPCTSTIESSKKVSRSCAPHDCTSLPHQSLSQPKPPVALGNGQRRNVTVLVCTVFVLPTSKFSTSSLNVGRCVHFGKHVTDNLFVCCFSHPGNVRPRNVVVKIILHLIVFRQTQQVARLNLHQVAHFKFSDGDHEQTGGANAVAISKTN